MNLARPLPSDAQLADAARRGSTAAWDELDARHAWAVVAVAKSHRTNSPKRAAQLAMERVRVRLVEEVEPADGAVAVRAIRPMAIAELTDGVYGPAADHVDHDGVRADVLAEAFARLPETWQTVLWHGTVEGLSAAEMTPLLGRGVNEVLAVQNVARTGLHEAYLQLLASRLDEVDPGCRPVVPLLGAHARGTLDARQQRLVDDHLSIGDRSGDDVTDDAAADATDDGGGCENCTAARGLPGRLDVVLPPAIVPGIARIDSQRYLELVGSGNRAIGSAALFAARSDRVRRLAFAGAAVAVVLALVAAAILIRRPFDGSSAPASATTGTAAAPATTDDPAAGSSSVPGTAAPGTDPAPETTASTAPPSTLVDLRPEPSGPANTVELDFAPGARAEGIAAPPPLELDVELSSPGPILAGGTGTVDALITNTGADDVTTSVEIRTPRGLVFERVVTGSAECIDPPDDSPFCDIAVAAGATETVTLRFGLESSLVGRFVVETAFSDEPLEASIVAFADLVHNSVGNGDTVAIGNTVMTCVESDPACAGARDLTGSIVNRWDVPLQHIGAVPDLGWVNSSTATLELPDGAGIEAAFLYWSGDLLERDRAIPDDGSRRQVGLLVPGAEAPVTIEAQRLRLGDVDATQYLGYADVTEFVAAAGGGDYVVGDVSSVEVEGSYGGWALVVVTSDPDAPRRIHLITDPFRWFSPEHHFEGELPVPFLQAGTARLDVVAFEGEPGFVGETFTIAGTTLGGDNAFDGSITGPRDPAYVNSFGIDIDAYDLRIDAPAGTLPLEATSTKDGIRLAVLALSVDVQP